ncbi:MAG: hypothetical protein M3349_04120 [Actinomycetota bacterium]|nr:hypothetical protein [Actinomycetota bacterium]
MQNARIQNLGSAPSGAVAGQLYFDTSTNKLYWFNGTSWVLSGSGAETIALADLTDVSGKTGTGSTVVMDTSPTIVTPTIASFANATHDHQSAAGGGTLTPAAIPTFDTQVRTSRLDQMAAPTAAVALNSQKITGLADPVAAQDAATKAYVDATRQGLDIKDSVRVASTASVTVASPGASIDGVSLTAGDRVLLKNQTTGAENGIYIWNGAAVPMTRSLDADTSAEVTPGMFTFVEEGTQADTGWVLTTNAPITLGTTALAFTQFSGSADLVAGAGLTKTGNTLDVVGTANRITVAADSIDISTSYVGQTSITTTGTISTGTWQGTAVGLAYGGTGATTAAGARTALAETGYSLPRKYAADVGNGSLTSIVVNHGLNTRDVTVTVRDNATPYETMYPDIRATDVNNVTLVFATAPTSAQYRVIVTA